MSAQLPSGSWPTPVTADLVIQAARTLSGVALDGDAVYWSEMRPADGGRTQVVRLEPGRYADRRAARGQQRAHPGPRVRRRCVVGRATASSGTSSGPTSACAGSSPAASRSRSPRSRPRAARCAGPTATCTRSTAGWPSYARRTRWAAGARSTSSTRSSCSTPTAVQDVVVSGPDFVSDPRWSPDGGSLAWLEWDHPAMPWDSSTLKVQNAMGVVTVAGGVDEPARGDLPAALGAGRLAVVLLGPGRLVVALPLDARDRRGAGVRRAGRGRGAASGSSAQSRYAFLEDGRVVLAVRHEGRDSLRLLERGRQRHASRDRRHRGRRRSRRPASTVVLVGSSPVEEPACPSLRDRPVDPRAGPGRDAQRRP